MAVLYYSLLNITEKNIRVLYIAEITGKTGLLCWTKNAKKIKEDFKPDLIIAEADSLTNGSGLGWNHASNLHKTGVDVITTGDNCFFKKDLTENLEKIRYVLRPYNLSNEAPGRGCKIVTPENPELKNIKIAVAVFLGQSFFSRMHGENPFIKLPALLEKLREETPYIIIDFHSATSAEKLTLAEIVRGQCSALIGSHNKVQTSDLKILDGTAVITDAGRTGSACSVGGCNVKSRIEEYLTGIPDWTRPAETSPEIQGVLLDIDSNGRTVAAKALKIPVELPPQEAGAAQEASAGS